MLYSYTKCSCKTMRKISNAFYQEELTIRIFLVIFENIASKLEKIGPFFSSFNPFPSLPSVATDDRKQFQCRKLVFNNKFKARPLFLEFNCAKTLLSFFFKKILKQRHIAPLSTILHHSTSFRKNHLMLFSRVT